MDRLRRDFNISFSRTFRYEIISNRTNAVRYERKPYLVEAAALRSRPGGIHQHVTGDRRQQGQSPSAPFLMTCRIVGLKESEVIHAARGIHPYRKQIGGGTLTS